MNFVSFVVKKGQRAKGKGQRAKRGRLQDLNDLHELSALCAKTLRPLRLKRKMARGREGVSERKGECE